MSFSGRGPLSARVLVYQPVQGRKPSLPMQRKRGKHDVARESNLHRFIEMLLQVISTLLGILGALAGAVPVPPRVAPLFTGHGGPPPPPGGPPGPKFWGGGCVRPATPLD